MTKNILQLSCQKIISGGQTGVDRAILDVCLENNFDCGGWCPAGRLAEDGPIGLKYPLLETPETDYSVRTRKNVEESDGTLILSSGTLSGGTLLTYETALELKKPTFLAIPETEAELILHWILKNKITTLNIAGPRQSEWEDSYRIAFQLITSLIQLIRKNSRPENQPPSK